MRNLADAILLVLHDLADFVTDVRAIGHGRRNRLHRLRAAWQARGIRSPRPRAVLFERLPGDVAMGQERKELLPELAAGAVVPFTLGRVVLEPTEHAGAMDQTLRLALAETPAEPPADVRDIGIALVSALQVGAMQRGLDQESAVALIVNGFAKEVLQQLPMEFAVEAQKLLGISLEGSVG